MMIPEVIIRESLASHNVSQSSDNEAHSPIIQVDVNSYGIVGSGTPIMSESFGPCVAVYLTLTEKNDPAKVHVALYHMFSQEAETGTFLDLLLKIETSYTLKEITILQKEDEKRSTNYLKSMQFIESILQFTPEKFIKYAPILRKRDGTTLVANSETEAKAMVPTETINQLKNTELTLINVPNYHAVRIQHVNDTIQLNVGIDSSNTNAMEDGEVLEQPINILKVTHEKGKNIALQSPNGKHISFEEHLKRRQYILGNANPTTFPSEGTPSNNRLGDKTHRNKPQNKKCNIM